MSSSASDDTAVAGRPVSGLALAALLAPTVLAALSTLGVLAWTGGWLQDDRSSTGPGLDAFSMVVSLWDLLPFAAMTVLTSVAVRRWPSGLLALGVGALALAAGTAVVLWEMLVDESSTAVLLLLFLPFYQGVLVAVTAVATVGLNGALPRRPSRS